MATTCTSARSPPPSRFVTALREGRTPIVVIGDDWGRHVSTQQHLFRHLVDRFPMIWVNSFGHRRPRLTVYDVRRAAEKLLRMAAMSRPRPPAGGPRAIVNPKALPWHDVGLVRRFNTWSLRRDIRTAVALVAPGERPLLVSGTPAAYGLVGRCDEVASIYFCLDDYGEIHGVDRDLIAPLEREMLRRVDALVATAASLLVSKRPASGRTLHLPQGVNFEHFSRATTAPAELERLPRPILGFAGGVGPAIDAPLLYAVCRAFPSASVVLIGPLQEALSGAAPPNLHVLGPREYAELPRFVQQFDVGLIPYVLNDWTRAVDPLKLLEYLAAGVPVVSTALPEAAKYAASINVAHDTAAFIASVGRALGDGSPDAKARRQAVAGAQRWEQRASEFVRFAGGVADAIAAQRSPA